MPSFSIPAVGGALAASEGGAIAATAAATTAAAGAAAGSAASVFSTLGIVGSALGGVTSALGAINSASATAASANYEAQVAANNQTIANQNAQLASASGAAQVEQAGLKTKANVGAIEASQAASNIDVNQGSAVDVRSSAAELGQLDALTIRSNAEKTVYGYETQGAAFGAQESLAQSEAANAPVAGALGAVGSILGGATGVATQYSRWYQSSGTNPLTVWGGS